MTTNVRLQPKKGFSLIEVLITVTVLVIVINGLFGLFFYCTSLAAISRNMTLAMSEAQDKMEEIRDDDFDSIVADYGSPNNTFDLTKLSEDTNLNGVMDAGEDRNNNGGLDSYGKGVITVDATNPDLLEIGIVVCWRNQDGRIIGEDLNLNGTLDAGEDLNGNGVLDSPTIVVSYIARR